MMRYPVSFLLSLLLIIGLTPVPYCQTDSGVDNLLKNGKELIEKGEYTEAVGCIGKIMGIVGNQTNDPKIVAFSSTVQAYVGKVNSGDTSLNS